MDTPEPQVASPHQPTVKSPFPMPVSGRRIFTGWGWLAVLGLVAATVAAYFNSFHCPFIFEDWSALMGGETIKSWQAALFPGRGSALAGHPVAALSFAANYAWGGKSVVGYHVVNLTLHILAALTLFGLARETFRSPRLNARFGEASLPLAFAVAVLWAVHPLQTEAVTYIFQRTEVLAGFFYLLTVYAFARSVRSETPVRWQVLSVGACVLGALCKEILMTAPLVVFVYDGLFFARSWRDVWARRDQYYSKLSLVWVVLVIQLAWLGYGPGIFPDREKVWEYLLTSCRAWVEYLKLAVWPRPLIFDHGRKLLQHAGEVWIHLAVFFVSAGLTGFALWKRHVAGFVGVWFFGILVPVSLLLPILAQPMAEHRAYLPLAVVIATVVACVYRFLPRIGFVVFGAAAIGLGFLTFDRNKDYATEVGIWDDTIIKKPLDASRAFLNRGAALERMRDTLSAIESYQLAIIVDREYVDAHYALAYRLAKNPARKDEAVKAYQEVVRIMPDLVEAQISLGNLLLTMPGHLEEAIASYETVVRLQPNVAEFRLNLGKALALAPGRLAESYPQFEKALQLKPGMADAHFRWANALVRDPDRQAEAEKHYEESLRLDANQSECHYNLALLLTQDPNRTADVITHYRKAIELFPGNYQAHYNLGLLLRKDPATAPEAIKHFEEVLRIDPEIKAAQTMIDKIRAESGK